MKAEGPHVRWGRSQPLLAGKTRGNFIIFQKMLQWLLAQCWTSCSSWEIKDVKQCLSDTSRDLARGHYFLVTLWSNVQKQDKSNWYGQLCLWKPWIWAFPPRCVHASEPASLNMFPTRALPRVCSTTPSSTQQEPTLLFSSAKEGELHTPECQLF